MRALLRAVSLVLLTFAMTTSNAAQDLNLDFGAAFGPPSSAYGGAADQPGLWNEVDEIRTFDLLDLGGGPTGASVAVTSHSAEGEGTGGDGDTSKLLEDNFFDCVEPNEWTLTFNGLDDGLYDVYVYAPAHAAVGTGQMMVGGAALAALDGAPAPLVEGQNWVRVRVTVSGGGLELRGDAGELGCVGLAGMQLDHLDAEPPPSSCALEACVEDEFAMCLNDGRFRVTAEFDSPNNDDDLLAPAHAVRLTDDSGYLWFFADTNIEAIVKVIDGCVSFSRFWVFAGGLTNVRSVLHVCDTDSGVEKTYVNPPSTAFEPIQDTDAFATCD